MDAALKTLKGSLGNGLLFKKNGYLKIESYFDVNYVNDRGDKIYIGLLYHPWW